MDLTQKIPIVPSSTHPRLQEVPETVQQQHLDLLDLTGDSTEVVRRQLNSTTH